MACIRGSGSKRGSQDNLSSSSLDKEKPILQIYTDWANHYLERGRFKRFIRDLQSDVSDGVLLADVIEAVTGSKVPDIIKKPKGPSQMVNNIDICVSFLGDLGVSVEGILAKDIKEGHLKAILSLFFNLSRYKQAQKISSTAQTPPPDKKSPVVTPSTGTVENASKLPSSNSKQSMVAPRSEIPQNGPGTFISGSKETTSSIPAPSGGFIINKKVAMPERSSKIHQPLPAANSSPGIRGGSAKSSANSSRSSSPHASSSIPQPKGCSVIAREKVQDRNNSRPSSTSSSSSIPHLPVKNCSSGVSVQRTKGTVTPPNHVMLEKLKLNKERCPTDRTKGSCKRTSSSSGISSARSDPSDSSTSICSESSKTDSHQVPKALGQKVLAKRTPTKTYATSSSSSKHSSGLKVIPDCGRPPIKSEEDSVHYSTVSADSIIRQSKISSLVKKSSPRQSTVVEDGPGDQGASSIPKPTAAVKGTFKGHPDDRRVMDQSKEGSPKPVTPSPARPAFGLPRCDKSSISVAMVTPIVSTKSKCRPESKSSRNPHKAPLVGERTEHPINHSQKKAPEVMSFKGENAKPQESITNSGGGDQDCDSKLCPKDQDDEQEDVMSSIKPMQPIMRASPYGYTRLLTPPSSGGMVVPGLRLQGRGLLPPHPQHHPPRRMGLRKSINEASLDTAGYMSDGDVLASTVDDIPSGYLSEGGAAMSAKRTPNTTRSKDIKPINVLQDDRLLQNQVHLSVPRTRFDDSSSSMSSGISDTIAELSTDDNLTGSSLSSEANQPYVGDDLRPLRRPAVKKTDSCMQTESSAFHPSSSAAWKKYLQQSSAAGDGRLPSDLRSAHDRIRSDVAAKDKALTGALACGGSSSSSSSSTGNRGSGNLPPDHKSRHKIREEVDWPSRQSESPNQSPMRKQNNRSISSNVPTKRSMPMEMNGSRPALRLASAGRNGSTEKLTDPHVRGDSDVEGSRIYSNIQVPVLPRGQPSSGMARATFDQKSKAKVCANTQTAVNDIYGTVMPVHSDGEYSSLGSRHGLGNKYLIPNHRDRIYGSPSSDYAFLPGWSRTQRFTTNSNDNYVNLDHSGNYAWFRPAQRTNTTGLTEAESMESISSGGYSVHAQIQNARANSLTHARLMLHQREQNSSSPRLPRSRSNSIRSTQSEKLYPSMLQRSDDLDCDGPPSSPASQSGARFVFPSSPGASIVPSVSCQVVGRRSNSMSHYMGTLLSKSSKDEDVHGSSLSLVSTSSSLYSSAEEKQAHEIRKLKKELEQANEKVSTLTSQLTTNAHMVSAFEQSLSNMTNRLQHLTASAEQKDSELQELRSTIEALQKQSIEAGLTKMALQSMQASRKNAGSRNQKISRQLSAESMSSINSLSSTCSGHSTCGRGDHLESTKKKKKGWFRSSFSKAFSRSKKNKNGSVSDVEDHQRQSDSSAPNSPLLRSSHKHIHDGTSSPSALKASHSSSAIYDQDDEATSEMVRELRKELRQKDMVLTDIRLEALSSAHQLENLRETVNKMRSEMINLRQDNERLQRIVQSKSFTSSHSSLLLANNSESLEKRFSFSDGPISSSIFMNDCLMGRDGKKVAVSVLLGYHENIRFVTECQDSKSLLIGSLPVSGKTKWDLLDSIIRQVFKEYVLRIDPVSNLGLSAESVVCYHIGDVVHSKDADIPELLPYGYLVGDSVGIQIVLRGTQQNSVDELSFETLIPKSIVQRYVSLLSEHRRIILCGPSGTGKSYLAQKLSEFLVLRCGRELTSGSIATFSVDHKSAKELRQYLSNIADQCESSVPDLPTVIILDNLHHVGSLGEVFNGFLSSKYQKCPFIIGTMNQATCSTTNLQLHHNFRWVLCANHMEPVKGFLGRYLRRKLVEEEIQSGIHNNELIKIVEWVPKVWHHLNKFLETHSSSDVTIGPRLFLPCPMNVSGSLVWFTDLWNYSIIPYLLEAIREGLQLYGRRAPWEDPTDFVLQTYPWQFQSNEHEMCPLLRLRQEDVGYEAFSGTGLTNKSSYSASVDAESDPLLNMLMHLQEAASYSSPLRNSGDPLMLDHSSVLPPEEILPSGLESTL